MATKTIRTTPYGDVDIRKTAEKLSVKVDNRTYERVAWEDTNACYWVLVKGLWYLIDNMTIARQGRLGYRSVSPTTGVFGY